MDALSLIRAWIYGVALFAAMTVSLAIAFTIAITGPPTRSEMEGLQRLLAAVVRQAEPVAEQTGAALCADLPSEVTEPFCPDLAVAADETNVVAEPIPPAPTAPAPPEEIGITVAREVAPRANEALLGGEARVERAAPARAAPIERARRQARPERRQERRVVAARERRATPPRITSPRTEAVEPIAASDEGALTEIEPMTPQDIVAREIERPTQNEATPAEEYADEDYYADHSDDYAAEERAYEEEQRYREERRRYRQWRRRQAYYEQGQRSGGW
jgi:hypothetical protein